MLEEINHLALIGGLMQQMCVYLVIAYLLSKTPLFAPLMQVTVRLPGKLPVQTLTLWLPTNRFGPIPSPDLLHDWERDDSPPDLLPWERPDEDDLIDPAPTVVDPGSAEERIEIDSTAPTASEPPKTSSTPVSPLSADPGHVTQWP